MTREDELREEHLHRGLEVGTTLVLEKKLEQGRLSKKERIINKLMSLNIETPFTSREAKDALMDNGDNNVSLPEVRGALTRSTRVKKVDRMTNRYQYGTYQKVNLWDWVRP